MNFQEYFSADSASGQIVVQVLTWSFILWSLALVSYGVYLRIVQKKLKKSKDMSILKRFLELQAQTKQLTPSQIDEARQRQEADVVFKSYCGSASIKETSVMAQHIRAIFDAGWRETKLDTSELIKHTIGRIFAPSNLLKSFLTLFLIVGLFGTLIGLAESFGNLSLFASKDQYTSQTQQEFTGAVKNLLISLKGAFAPSLLGILYTVAGVLFFSIFVAFFSRLKSDIESMTLTKWVPELFASSTLNRKYGAAEKVALFAENIVEVSEKFSSNIRLTNGVLENLIHSSKRLIDHTDRFVEGVNKIGSFEDRLRQLYQQMVSESQTFHQNVKDTLKHIRDAQDKTSENLEGQGEQIKLLVGGLKSYEEAYIIERKELDSKIKEVLVAARNSYSGIVQRNQELITKVGDPLRNELVAKINEINQTLNSNLTGIQKKFEDFDAPISAAAQKIGDSLDTVMERTDRINQEFHREFIEQTENNTRQLTEIKSFNTQMSGLLNDLKLITSQQTNQFGKIDGSLGKIDGSMGELATSITSLGRTVRLSNGQDVAGGATNSPLSLFQLAELLVRIARNAEVQNDNHRKLLQEINALKSQPPTDGNRWGILGK